MTKWLWYSVLVSNKKYKVENSLGTHINEVFIRFFEPVMHLGRRSFRAGLQPGFYIFFVWNQQFFTAYMIVDKIQVFYFTHIQIFFDCSPVQTQFPAYLRSLQAISVLFVNFMIHNQ